MPTPTKPKSAIERYVVLSDAIVVTIGTKPNGRANYTRVLRGGVINGNPESEQIVTFLRARAIRLVKDDEELARAQADLLDPATSRLRQTAKKSHAAMGAEDPVQPVQKSVEPVPAPLPDGGVD